MSSLIRVDTLKYKVRYSKWQRKIWQESEAIYGPETAFRQVHAAASRTHTYLLASKFLVTATLIDPVYE